MVDLHRILADHRTRTSIKQDTKHVDKSQVEIKGSRLSEIPDLFFDEILKTFKLSRIDISVVMFIYRKIWCRPNLNRAHGISPILSHKETASFLGVSLDDFYHSLKKLEDLGFITTIRSGQYFVRRFFLKEFDDKFNQDYDDFNV